MEKSDHNQQETDGPVRSGIRPAWLCLDLRALALYRIFLGLILVSYGFLRILTAEEYLSDDGVVPGHYNLFNPPARLWSLLNAFSSLWEVMLVLTGMQVVFLCFTAGIGGRPVKLLALISSISLLTRNIWIENGGHIVLNILLFWSFFLPLDERWSFSSFSRRGTLSFREWFRRDLIPGRYCGLATAGLLFSCILIYLFNYLSKTGVTWTEGSAVHYTLWLSSRLHSPGFWCRTHLSETVLRWITCGVLLIEGVLPLLLISPWGIVRFRRVAAFLIVVLHGGIALLINLGVFSWVMICFALAFFPWQGFQGCPTESSSAGGVARLRSAMCNLIMILMIYAQTVQSIFLYTEWMHLPRIVTPPDWVSLTLDYMRMPQNWRMFSTDAPVQSSHILRLARRSGRWIDLDLNHELPDLSESQLRYYFVTPLHQNHLRIELNTRVPVMPGDYHVFMGRYLMQRFPGYELYQIWLLERASPPPGQTETVRPIRVRKLWEYPILGSPSSSN